MGGNDRDFWTWVFVRAAPGLAWRVALHYWPATLAIGAIVVWLVL